MESLRAGSLLPRPLLHPPGGTIVRECSFILPNGRKCGCAATRNQSLCRHHAPKPAVPGPPPPSRYERYSDLIRWRRLGSNLPWMPIAEIPRAIYEILECLIDRGDLSTGHISDLTAGRFLRALLNRCGAVPFPSPGFDDPSDPTPDPDPTPTPKPALASADIDKWLASLAALAPSLSHASLHQSHAPVHQSHASPHQSPSPLIQSHAPRK